MLASTIAGLASYFLYSDDKKLINIKLKNNYYVFEFFYFLLKILDKIYL